MMFATPVNEMVTYVISQPIDKRKNENLLSEVIHTIAVFKFRCIDTYWLEYRHSYLHFPNISPFIAGVKIVKWTES